MFLQPLILLHLIPDEEHSQLSCYLHACLTFLAVVEPCLCPPSDACLVGIDAHRPWYVEALHLDVKIRERVCQAAVRYGLPVNFFFTSSSHEDRYVP